MARLIPLLAVVTSLLFGSKAVRAHESPLGCTGSALGINLFTDVGDVHIGDRIQYSATDLEKRVKEHIDIKVREGLIKPRDSSRASLLRGRHAGPRSYRGPLGWSLS